MNRFACKLVCGALVLLAMDLGAVGAQDETPRVVDLPDVAAPAEMGLESAVEQFTALVEANRPFQVEASSRWKRVTGDNAVEGSESISLLRRSRDHLRLEIRLGDDADPAYVAVADGKSLTTWLRADRIHEQHATDEPLRHLESCSLSQGILESCGIDFLMVHDLADYVSAQVVSVTGLAAEEGVTDVGPRFEISLQDGTTMLVEFNRDASPLPVKLRVNRNLTVAEGVTSSLTIETTLKWKMEGVDEANQYSFQLPADSRLVSELDSQLVEGESMTLVGKALPELSLQAMDAAESTKLEITRPTVLYFWATWAAPSIDEIPRLSKFVSDANEKGVQVIGVNLAEEPDHVREFVKLNRFEGEVRIDRTGQAVNALQLTELPAVVVVGADGKVIAVRENSAEDFEPELRKLLEMLVK